MWQGPSHLSHRRLVPGSPLAGRQSRELNLGTLILDAGVLTARLNTHSLEIMFSKLCPSCGAADILEGVYRKCGCGTVRRVWPVPTGGTLPALPPVDLALNPQAWHSCCAHVGCPGWGQPLTDSTPRPLLAAVPFCGRMPCGMRPESCQPQKVIINRRQNERCRVELTWE